ncbi:MAG: zf-HC2 domain-containing protein [Limisphaerales bacterium]
MKCEDFSDKLPEYLDGMLSVAEQAAAQEHLQQCTRCQRLLQHQGALAKLLRFALDQETHGLSLDLETRRNILDAWRQPKPRRKAWDRAPAWLALIWRRPAWTGAVLLSLLLLISGAILYRHPAASTALPSTATKSFCVIDVPIQTKIHVSRNENNIMVDAVIPGVMVAQATFSRDTIPLSH